MKGLFDKVAHRFAAILIVLAVADPAVAQDHGHDQGMPIHVGSPAPAFTLPVANAATAGTSQIVFPGSPGHRLWVVSLFAEWCPGCRNELPTLAELDHDYRAKGVSVVVVSVDSQPDAASRLGALLKKSPVGFPVALDSNETVLHAYEGSKTSLPYVLVVDSTGTVTLAEEGFSPSTSSTLRAELDKLLAAEHAHP